MTPGTTDIPIFRGAKWTFRFTFEVVATGEPLDLTGMGPFVCEAKKINKDEVLATATVVSNYDDEGWVEITFSPAQTNEFPLGEIRVGLRDTEFNPLLEWVPEVKWFTPT